MPSRTYRWGSAGGSEARRERERERESSLRRVVSMEQEECGD
jgi:hypothetical protein